MPKIQKQVGPVTAAIHAMRSAEWEQEESELGFKIGREDALHRMTQDELIELEEAAEYGPKYFTRVLRHMPFIIANCGSNLSWRRFIDRMFGRKSGGYEGPYCAGYIAGILSVAEQAKSLH